VIAMSFVYARATSPIVSVFPAVPGIRGSYRFRNVSNGSGRFTNMAAGVTYHAAYALEGHVNLVRLVFANDTAAAIQINAAAVAPSARLGTGFAPVNAADAPSPWTVLGFNNAGADVAFHEQLTGSAATLSVPATTDTNNPTLACTDWAQVSTIDRIDEAGGLPLLFVRSFAAATARAPAATTGDFSNPAAWASVNQGRAVVQGAKTGDFTSTNQAGFVAPITTNDILPTFALQYYRRAPGFAVMTIGDSLAQGFKTIANANSFGFQACVSLSTPSRPVTHLNAGASSFTSAQYTTRAYREIELFRPDVVLIPAMSPNDAVNLTLADANLSLSRALALCAFCQNRGVVPVLVTAVPFANYTAAEDLLRHAINAQVRQIGIAGTLPVIDADAAVTDSANPARPRPELVAGANGDGAHLADAGHAAIAAVAVPVLRRILGY
jgi:hypothetical protein